jgi:hypothetical protein
VQTETTASLASREETDLSLGYVDDFGTPENWSEAHCTSARMLADWILLTRYVRDGFNDAQKIDSIGTRTR